VSCDSFFLSSLSRLDAFSPEEVALGALTIYLLTVPLAPGLSVFFEMRLSLPSPTSRLTLLSFSASFLFSF